MDEKELSGFPAYFMKFGRINLSILDFFGTDETLTRKVVKGGIWVSIGFSIEKVLGFIRSVVLARLLMPEDFGLMGVAIVAIGGLTVFTNTGIEPAIIQRKKIDKYLLNTAWVISVGRGCILALLLFVSAPLIATFFSKEKLIPILRVISIIFLVSGIRNIGFVLLQKELDFRRRTYFKACTGSLTTMAAIVLAFMFRNVWALVFAEVIGSILGLIGSYFIHPFRPSFTFKFKHARELISFGKFIFIEGIIIYLITRGDDAVVGKVIGITGLGYYTLAYTVANMFTRDITGIVTEVVFPAYAKIQDEKDKLAAGYLKVLTITSFIIFPTAGLLFAFSPEFVKIIYGPKWLPIILTLQILCFLGVFRAIGATMGPVFTGTGRPDILMKIKLRELGLMVIIIFPFVKYWGINGAAMAGTLTYLLSLGLHMYYLNCILSKIIGNIFNALRSTLIATCGMVLTILMGKYFISDISSVVILLALFVISVLIYFICFLGLEYKRILQLKKMYVKP